MNVKFYLNEKRVNSTKLPVAAGVTIACNLKRDTSMLNPTLELSINPFSERYSYNYAYIEEFGRYYFIDEWTYNEGRWNAHLSVDVLASWKAFVLDTTAFVEYSSSDYSVDYTDNRVMTTGKKAISSEEIPVALAPFDTTGCYILSIISTDANGDNGAVAAYALTNSQLSDFCEKITSEDWLDSVWSAIGKLFANPFDALVGCRWVPFKVDSLSGETKNIKAAYVDTEVSAKLLTSNFTGMSIAMPIPKRAEGEGAKYSFLDNGSFTTSTLYLPFIGMVPFDIDAYYGDDQFVINLKCDVVTGDLVYGIGASYTTISSTYAGNCSTTIPLTNTTAADAVGMAASSTGVIGGIISTVVSIVKDKGISAIAKGLGIAGASTIGAVKSAELHTQTNGALSSRIGTKLGISPRIVTFRNELLDDPFDATRIATSGLPCYKTLLLSDLSGYCKCLDASVDVACTSTEIEQINSYLNSGFYIE